MQLIGMLDSPYVRRVAISLQLLGLRFEHRSLSVFRQFDEFSRINPVVKAPSLVCNDGTVLMDSSLILEYAEAMATGGRSLMPRDLAERRRVLRRIGLALAACEKAVQVVYEHHLRPAEKLHQPWLDRVAGQLEAAFTALEAEFDARPMAADSAALDQGDVSTAVAWFFTQQMLPGMVPVERHPNLHALSAMAESLPEFCAAPHGDSTYRAPD
jgi:glutathione S-transferase